MNVLIVISSKFPNEKLYECIEKLYEIQINEALENYKICVIDSDSDDFMYYRKINENFPNVEIHFIKNKNYEYGAWKNAHIIYPNYDIYFCIQDSYIIQKKIDLSIINDNTVYTAHRFSGYNEHIGIKEEGIQFLKDSGLNYESIIDTDFNLAWGSMFIVNNYIITDIFKTLQIEPINKNGSCIYERNFGIYFIIKEINTINFFDYFIKFHSGRQ
uniref:Glycosyltransferase 2-like domain-containing protein n=1 Tax=viral metagenome TaxID=1070528 RepID=A0A6C0KXX2_9ZZZZ